MSVNFFKIALLVVLTSAPICQAAENQSGVENHSTDKPFATMNAILFSEGEQSWTQRDFNLYKKILNYIPKKENPAGMPDSLADSFLISRMLGQEAEQFEIQPEKLELSSGFKTELVEYSKAEINEELKIIALSRALLDLKEKQMSQQIRFKAWIEVLKRKYAVKIKSNDFSKTTR